MSQQVLKQRENGSFCVITKFTTSEDTDDLKDKVVDWCNRWIAEHKDWQRPTDESGVDINKDSWDYSEIFIGPPYVIKAEDNQLWLRLDVRIHSYWWRDWFASMMGGLVRAFPELHVSDRIFFSCDGST